MKFSQNTSFMPSSVASDGTAAAVYWWPHGMHPASCRALQSCYQFAPCRQKLQISNVGPYYELYLKCIIHLWLDMHLQLFPCNFVLFFLSFFFFIICSCSNWSLNNRKCSTDMLKQKQMKPVNTFDFLTIITKVKLFCLHICLFIEHGEISTLSSHFCELSVSMSLCQGETVVTKFTWFSHS